MYLAWELYVRLNFDDFNYVAGVVFDANIDGEAGCGEIEFGAGAGVRITGELSGPSPTRFSGSFSGYAYLDFGWLGELTLPISGSVNLTF